MSAIYTVSEAGKARKNQTVYAFSRKTGRMITIGWAKKNPTKAFLFFVDDKHGVPTHSEFAGHGETLYAQAQEALAKAEAARAERAAEKKTAATKAVKKAAKKAPAKKAVKKAAKA